MAKNKHTENLPKPETDKSDKDKIKHCHPTDINKVLESIDSQKREVIMEAMYAIEKSSSFSGPLPAPEDFQAYMDVLPSAPERILAMAEKQSEHRMNLERYIVNSGINEAKRGQLFGFVLAIVFLLAAIYLGMNDHDWLAVGIIAIIASISVIFVLKKEPRKENTTEVIDLPEESK